MSVESKFEEWGISEGYKTELFKTEDECILSISRGITEELEETVICLRFDVEGSGFTVGMLEENFCIPYSLIPLIELQIMELRATAYLVEVQNYKLVEDKERYLIFDDLDGGVSVVLQCLGRYCWSLNSYVRADKTEHWDTIGTVTNPKIEESIKVFNTLLK